MKKTYRKETIALQLVNYPTSLVKVGGPLPYINISPVKGAIVGTIPDRSIKKLRRWCEEILESRNT